MSRRRKFTITAPDLLNEIIAGGIKKIHGIDIDPHSIMIEAYALHTPTIRVDVEAIISRLERYIYINGDKDVDKSQLQKITKISRPTINRLFKIGILKPTISKTYILSSIVEQLKDYKKNIKPLHQ